MYRLIVNLKINNMTENTTFTIIEHKKTSEKWLAKPYWLDPSSKWTLFANYKENQKPIFIECGLGMNEYRSEVKIVGKFETNEVIVDSRNNLTFKNK